MPKENDKEKNHFLALVDQFGDVIEEKHLEMLLKSEFDLISKVYTWILTTFIGITVAASALKVVIDPFSIWGWLPIIPVAIVIVILIILIKYIKKIDPLKVKRDRLENFLVAKRYLAKTKKRE